MSVRNVCVYVGRYVYVLKHTQHSTLRGYTNIAVPPKMYLFSFFFSSFSSFIHFQRFLRFLNECSTYIFPRYFSFFFFFSQESWEHFCPSSYAINVLNAYVEIIFLCVFFFFFFCWLLLDPVSVCTTKRGSGHE